jgi:ubiquinone/menaquinone biosynthesis C-methylase UbiE
MVCHGGFSLDEKTRRTWYDPEEILSSAELRNGMSFADIGSGEGFFSILAAKVVGPKGKVYSVDLDGEAIARLNHRAAETSFSNIEARVGKAEETIFCTGCIDIVFYSMVLHDFHDPIKVLKNARTMLKSSGSIVNLDWKKKSMPFGPPEQIRFSEEMASNLIMQAGLKIADVRQVGPYHYVVIAKK